jgi:hypothetical protein
MQSVASTSRMSGYPCGSTLPQHGGPTLVPSAPPSVSPAWLPRFRWGGATLPRRRGINFRALTFSSPCSRAGSAPPPAVKMGGQARHAGSTKQFRRCHEVVFRRHEDVLKRKAGIITPVTTGLDHVGHHHRPVLRPFLPKTSGRHGAAPAVDLRAGPSANHNF